MSADTMVPINVRMENSPDIFRWMRGECPGLSDSQRTANRELSIANCFSTLVALEAALTPGVVLLEAPTLAEAPLAALAVAVAAQESFVPGAAARVWLVPSEALTVAWSVVAPEESDPAEFRDTAVSSYHP